MSPLVTALMVAFVVLAGVAVMAASTIGAANQALNLDGGRRQTRTMQILVIPFFGIFIAAGLFFGGLSVQAAWRDRVSMAWPQVSGRIIRSTVKGDSSSDGDAYKPDIGYHYTVDGREFTGKCVSFGIDRIAGSYGFANRYVGRYPVGAVVRVSYQPGQPEIAALETGLTRHSFTGAVMGLFFVAAGVYAIWAYGGRDRFPSTEGRPFLRVLPAFVGFGVFFGLMFWLSGS